MSNKDSISLNKYISQTGLCSRREADRMIQSGRVFINSNVASKGNRVNPGDKVTVDGQLIKSKPKSIYIALHKPPGITCTTDRKDKDNIIDYINHPKRIFPIGRLDKASTGLILLTNDGDIVNKILRVENTHEKEYIVTVNKVIASDFIKKMSQGVPILGTQTKKCHVVKLGHKKFKIILTQGLNQRIRRMCQYLGYRVVTLKRIRIINIDIDHLPLGRWRYLTPQELSELTNNIQSSTKS